jgi:hypothetical protein
MKTRKRQRIAVRESSTMLKSILRKLAKIIFRGFLAR